MEDIDLHFKDLRTDLKEIKQTLVENTVALAEYNAELKVHIQASKDLNARMIPIEDHVKFLRKLGHVVVTFFTWSAAFVTIVATAVKLFVPTLFK